MARARNIKPSFFDNEKLASLCTYTRLLFIGLWTIADAYGKLEDRPSRIKKQLLGYENVDAEPLLKNLEQSGFIQRYSVNGQNIIRIPNFIKHQHPHPNELRKESEFPDPVQAIENKATRNESGKNESAPDNNGAHGPLTESPLLNTESLKSLSGSTPDPDPPKPEVSKNAELKAQATEILQFLNSKTGRNYQAVNGTLKPLMARLREGFTVTQCRQVIAKKARDWAANEKMEPYLRPKTLFAQENFANYIGELEVIDEQPN